MGIYAQHAATYSDAGLPVFPVDARSKKPAVRNWQNTTLRQSRGWANVPSLAANDGLGIVMGKPSGIIEIDVDAVGESWLAAAIERFGETPIVIRTASRKAKLWYKHNGEGRRIRPFGNQPIDVLGGGFTIASPSWREDLGTSYAFKAGGIEDIGKLPTIAEGALSDGFIRAPEGVLRGERNNSLWRFCMSQARHCDDVESLIDTALTWTNAFPEPLSAIEAEQCARSAWGYETSGCNYLGLKKPQLNDGDRLMDQLIDQPEALVLLQMFQRWHKTRPFFAIAPTAMSRAGSPPWYYTRIIRARDILLGRGYLIEVIPPRRGVSAGHYRLSVQIADSDNNHNTSLPPVLDCLERQAETIGGF